MTATWDPVQYLAFGGHRLRPALELLARIPHQAPARVADLGCGPGNVTKFLRERWPDAELEGIDSSSEMLAAAAAELSSAPGVSGRALPRGIRGGGAAPGIAWREASFATWEPAAPMDVIYSNAALHWEGHHEKLFPRLMDFLAPGGVLAVQMPRNFGEPSHTSMRVAAAKGPWAETLAGAMRPDPVNEPDFYYGLLAPLTSQLDLWETRYMQVLNGENPVAEFTKGSWLKPILDQLEEPLRGEFEAEYRRLVLEHYPQREDGVTLFPFTRLFVLATK